MKSGPESELVNRYLTRAEAGGRQLGLSGFAISEFAESRSRTAETRKADEATMLTGALQDGAFTIILDERGKSISSEHFAEIIGRERDQGRRDMSFVIGGPDGLDKTMRQSADLVLSFSALTWPHQMVRIMLAEQIYRATTILAGHPYHRV